MIFSPYKNVKINNMNSLYIGLFISLTVHSCGLFESNDPGFGSEKISVMCTPVVIGPAQVRPHPRSSSRPLHLYRASSTLQNVSRSG